MRSNIKKKFTAAQAMQMILQQSDSDIDSHVNLIYILYNIIFNHFYQFMEDLAPHATLKDVQLKLIKTISQHLLSIKIIIEWKVDIIA